MTVTVLVQTIISLKEMIKGEVTYEMKTIVI